MSGRIYGVGVGPGDPELLTVKADRLIRSCEVIAYFAAAGRKSNALGVIAGIIGDAASNKLEIRLEYPVTTEALPDGVSYADLLSDFYDESAKNISDILDSGTDVAVICEGDPFLYGSYMYLHARLSGKYQTEVIPGISSILAGAAVLGTPLVCHDESLTVLSGMLPTDELVRRLREVDSAVIIKVGRNLPKVKTAIEEAGLLGRARYVERATMATQRLGMLGDLEDAPYFSLVVVPSLEAEGA